MTPAPDSDQFGLQPPTFADIADAARRLAGRATITPLHENAALNETLGGRILVKCENLQRTGSFKFRGAYNFISHLDDEAREIGVVSYSSGNHAQGVAAAARLMGVPAPSCARAAGAVSSPASPWRWPSSVPGPRSMRENPPASTIRRALWPRASAWPTPREPTRSAMLSCRRRRGG